MSKIKIKSGSGFEAKSIVSTEARDGYFTKANIFYNGKKIATYLDEGNGGEVEVNYIDGPRGDYQEEVNRCSEYHAKVKKYLDLINPFVIDTEDDEMSKLYPFSSFDDSSQLEILFETIIVDTLVERDFKRWCKTSVVFQLNSDKVDTWQRIKFGRFPKQEVIDYVAKKYGSEIREILNLRFQ